MAPSNFHFFLVSLLMAISLSSIHTSWVARNLLQASQPGLPTIPPLPKPTLSPMPAMPNLPTATLPPMPTTPLPTLSKPTLPPMPTTMPIFPKVVLPLMPAMPSIPTTLPSFPFFTPPPSN
ncbi:hypothetical protein ACS0TY_029435 [Phlomoides rotata]